METISWLENFLADYENIVIVVSHDRHFLDACTHVADVDRAKIKAYTGNYTFWYESSQLIARQMSDKNKRQKTNVQRSWSLSHVSQLTLPNPNRRLPVKSPEKLTIEEIEPSNRRYPGIIFKQQREVGNQILNITKLAKKADDGTQLFADITFSLNKGDKVALVSKIRWR